MMHKCILIESLACFSDSNLIEIQKGEGAAFGEMLSLHVMSIKYAKYERSLLNKPDSQKSYRLSELKQSLMINRLVHCACIINNCNRLILDFKTN